MKFKKMKTKGYIFFALLLSGLFGCKSMQNVTVQDGTQFQLKSRMNSIEIQDMGQMEWNRRKDDCTANYSFSDQKLCFQHSNLPKPNVAISADGQQIAVISDIKKFKSAIEWEGKEFSLRPVRGFMVLLDKSNPIARIYISKGKWFLEVAPGYEENKILISALVYKHKEWQKTKRALDDAAI